MRDQPACQRGMADTTILLNGFNIIGSPQTNTNASGGGELMIHDGEAVFEDDDIIVMLVENVTEDGSLTGDSVIVGLIVYDNATDYYYGTAKYTYDTSPGAGVDVGSGRNAMGDSYLQVDATNLISTDTGAPVLEDLTIAAGIDILDLLENTSGPIEVGTIQDIDTDGDGTPDTTGDGLFSSDINALAVICFARGTLIETPGGPVPVEALEVGDMVNTLDSGPQPLRWIGSCRTDGTGHNAPVLIRRGAMGNVRDLLVSPNHRMMVRGPRAELLFGASEVLVAAKYLVDGDGIAVHPMREIEYFHFLLDRHEIVFAEACAAETLYPGRQSLRAVTDDARAEIIELFPEIAKLDSIGPMSRPALRAYEAQALRAIA